ncbi:hypothetical protein CI610_02736 [invertebrate metagenome]|uniref:Uncharacterized protein n=1 Tax=invertebrate metagenome TaxID=1711999 RepID=A0A2H9T538_9ZZZZ
MALLDEDVFLLKIDISPSLSVCNIFCFILQLGTQDKRCQDNRNQFEECHVSNHNILHPSLRPREVCPATVNESIPNFYVIPHQRGAALSIQCLSRNLQ